MTTPRAERGLWLAVAVCGAAFALRFLWLDLPGLNGDEGYFGWKALRAASGDFARWRTGSARPMSPFFIAPTALLHALGFPPSIALARSVAALSGVATAALAWWVYARLYGRVAGAAFGVLFATLPLQLAYSRIYWDPCQSVLACLLCLYLARRHRPLACALVFACALVIHPTNVFLLPCLLLPFVQGLGRKLRGRALLLGAALLAVGLLGLLVIVDDLGSALRLRGNPLARPAELWRFPLLWLDLLSGVTVYRYLVGTVPAISLVLHRVLGAALVLWLAIGALRRGASARIGGQAAALLASACLFYLIGGCASIAPHRERYALWLVAPSLELLGLLAIERLGAVRLRRGVLALGVVFLGLFCHHGLVGLTTSRAVHRAFLTGPVEPRVAVVDWLRRQTSGATVVDAEDWWTYWPLRYLAPEPRLRFRIPGQEPDYRFPDDFGGGPPADYAVVYVGGAEDERLRALSAYERVHIVRGHPDQRPLLAIYRRSPD